MKKKMQLAAATILAALALGLNPGFVRRAWASVEGTWLYHQFIVNGNSTMNGNLTVTGTFSPAITSVASLTTTGRVGLGAATPGAGTEELLVLSPSASTIGAVIQSAASPTADILDVKSNTTLVAAVTPSGFFAPRQMTLAAIQAFTPVAADVGGLVVCTNCANAYSVCRSTGAVLQGFSLGASGSLAECK